MNLADVARDQCENLVLAAAFLARRSEFVVVGGCALKLHGHDHRPPDLDLIPEPSSANLRRLFNALDDLGNAERAVRPNDHALATREILTRTTSVGLIDVLLERGREEYGVLAQRAVSISVRGRGVRVASVEDVLSLRTRFGKVVFDV